jgi:ATP-dependent protease ClpP protease subunit
LDIKNREIYFHGYLGELEEDPGVDWRCAAVFCRNIRALDKMAGDSILIHMQSVGGEWGPGMAIFDAIRMCESHVTILAYGQAESMSSIILQAADRRVMMPNAYHMCHYGSGGIHANHLDVQKAAGFEKRICEDMMDIYAHRCKGAEYFKEKWDNITDEKIKNYLKRKMKDGDWYMSAEESVYYGFADEVLENNINSLKQ